MRRPRMWMGQGRAKRREMANARRADAAKRSPEQQLARLDRAGWKAGRERQRLTKRIHGDRS